MESISIRVLLADDEAAIRNGLQNAIPWEQYHAKVVACLLYTSNYADNESVRTSKSQSSHIALRSSQASHTSIAHHP